MLTIFMFILGLTYMCQSLNEHVYLNNIVEPNVERLYFCSRGGIDIDISSLTGIDVKVYDLKDIFDEIPITTYIAKYTSDTSIAISLSNGLKMDTYVEGRISCFVSDKFIDSFTQLDEYYNTVYIMFFVIIVLILVPTFIAMWVIIFLCRLCKRSNNLNPDNNPYSNPPWYSDIIDGVAD